MELGTTEKLMHLAKRIRNQEQTVEIEMLRLAAMQQEMQREKSALGVQFVEEPESDFADGVLTKRLH